MLVVADELGPEGGEGYTAGSVYGLLDPEAASAAAEALNEGLMAAMRPAAEPAQNQGPEFLGIQAEVPPKLSLLVICLSHNHCRVRHCDASPLPALLGSGIWQPSSYILPTMTCPSMLEQAALPDRMLQLLCRRTVQRSRCCRMARWGSLWRVP